MLIITKRRNILFSDGIDFISNIYNDIEFDFIKQFTLSYHLFKIIQIYILCMYDINIFRIVKNINVAYKDNHYRNVSIICIKITKIIDFYIS